jgi:hypothetical protein
MIQAEHTDPDQPKLSYYHLRPNLLLHSRSGILFNLPMLVFYIMREQVDRYWASFQLSKPRARDLRLFFERWLRLKIKRIVSEIAASLAITDNECYVNVAELSKLVKFSNQGKLPSVQYFAAYFRRVDSHNQLRIKSSIYNRGDDGLSMIP